MQIRKNIYQRKFPNSKSNFRNYSLMNKFPRKLFINNDGCFHGISTTRTKVFSYFDKMFSVCRALNSKQFDKKIFFKSFCFHRERNKILLAIKRQKRLFSEF
jgi:hypothetical protein